MRAACRFPVEVARFSLRVGRGAGRLAMWPVIVAARNAAELATYRPHICERLIREIPVDQVKGAVAELEGNPDMDIEKAVYLASLAVRGVEVADDTKAIPDATTQQLARKAVDGLFTLPAGAELPVSKDELSRVIDLAGTFQPDYTDMLYNQND